MKKLLQNKKTMKPQSYSLRLAGAAVLVGAATLLGAGASACDECNLRFVKEQFQADENKKSLPEFATTSQPAWVSESIARAAANQKGLPLDGLSNLQKPSEEFFKTVMTVAKNDESSRQVAQAEAKTETPAPEPAKAVAAKYDPTAIVKRDSRLSIPATSFVDQSVKADKKVEIVLHEGKTYIGNGVMYDGFLMNDKIPGPTVQLVEGDVVEFTVKNEGDIPHGASIHAAYTQTSKFLGNIPPGETRTLKFKVNTPGVYMYHCAPGGHAIGMHVLGGQYGMIMVEPKKKYKLEKELGKKPDLELFLVQHELYSNGKDAIEGKPLYTMFNGQLFRYVEAPIKVRPGDYVRINFLNVGPNLLSTFHIVGIIWDYVYWQGNPEAVLPGGQSVTAGPTDSFVIEFRIPPAEGSYTMLSHAVGSTNRGAVGLLVADGKHEPAGQILADGPEYNDEQYEANKKKAIRTISPFGIGTPDVDAPVKFKDKNDEVVVKIIGNSYSPKIVEVPVGTTVTWINEEAFTYLAGEVSGIHNVVATSGPERFAGPLLSHAQKWSKKFTKKGTYEYQCAPHPYMRGIVRVK